MQWKSLLSPRLRRYGQLALLQSVVAQHVARAAGFREAKVQIRHLGTWDTVLRGRKGPLIRHEYDQMN
jgi:hypothetical protein